MAAARSLSGHRLEHFHKALLAWFLQHRRDLPWRTTRDAYPIWVSEVMLQQTTVATVVPYFTRFMQAFPTIQALAESEEQQVLAHWSGLGYYRRARFLHAAAKRLFAQHGNTLPDDPEVWTELPGIGRYTLGAILSQAFDRKLPIVEANTARVLSRLFAENADPKSSVGLKKLWQHATDILPESRCGDFNQAMMELGSLVCTPDAPKCNACPVAKFCEANRLGLQSTIPPKPTPKIITEVQQVALALQSGNDYLLVQRPLTATRGAGFWEFPATELQPSESPEQACHRLAAEMFDVKLGEINQFAMLRHRVTRFAITLTGMKATTIQEISRPHFRLCSSIEKPTLPMSSPQKRLWQALRNPRKRLF